MKNMTLAHITEVCGGIYFGPEEKKTAEVTDIVTDSRKAGEGSLFVAIPGERVDGHKFIPNVASQGALAVISEQKLETPPCPYILVKDSMEPLKQWQNTICSSSIFRLSALREVLERPVQRRRSRRCWRRNTVC